MAGFLVNSVGGCGSKYVVKKLMAIGDDPTLKKCHKHLKSPDLVDEGVEKVVFVFGDVILSVVSFFNRRLINTVNHGFVPKERNTRGDLQWAKKHCENLGGDFERMDEQWGLEEFVLRGEDFFGLHDFYSDWFELANSPAKFDTCFVRYESLPDNFDRVLDFLDIKADVDMTDFITRDSSVDSLNTEVANRLETMYEGLNRRIMDFPDFYVTS
ncbi:MAG: hypothetical protein LAT77_10545 [Aliidiomarina sp.]|uniref:hypothetical protein n=1 Tax=Aliidiomarina sp. TaxID=1872439 RepID=UPI0025C23B39|nr:hypothetical protein [Aliidiomarina sp.]MCH8502333.1 hypothetical protein [Aliidiomarina sp.]